MGQRSRGLLTAAGSCLSRNQIFLITLPHFKILFSSKRTEWDKQGLITATENLYIKKVPRWFASRFLQMWLCRCDCSVLQQAERRLACGSAPTSLFHVCPRSGSALWRICHQSILDRGSVGLHNADRTRREVPGHVCNKPAALSK